MSYHCRTCLRGIEDENFVSVGDDALSDQIKLELKICVPEMVLERVKDPVLCPLCVSALHMAYNFKAQCIKTERRITNYMQLTPVLERSVQAIKMEAFTAEPPTQAVDAARHLQPPPKKPDVVDDLNSLLNDVLSVQDSLGACGETEKKLVKTVLQPVETKLTTIPVVDTLTSDTELDDDIFIENVISSDSESVDEDVPENIELRECSVTLRKLPDTLVYFNASPFNRIVKPWRIGKEQSNPKPQGDTTKGSAELFKCKESACNYNSVHKWAITKHAVAKHGACYVCEFRTTSQKDLKDHIKGHRQAKQFKKNTFQCTDCNHKARSNTALREHMRTHTGEKPYACEMCSYRTGYKGNLGTHIKKQHILG